MFKSLSLKFFNNLHKNEIYKTTFQKQWGDLQQKFFEGIERVRKLEELENQKEKFLNGLTLDNRERNEKAINRYVKDTFDDKIEELKKYSDRVGEEPIEFWRDYKKKWDKVWELRKGNRKSEEANKVEEDLQKEYVKYRNRRFTIEGIYGKIIEELKKGLKGKKLSLNEINTILQNVNDSLYKVFDTDRQHRTQIDNAKKLLKGLFNKLSVEENVDVYDIVDFLENINVRKLSYNVYEQSFCDCGGNYFRDCNKKDGDKSYLFPNAVQQMKTYLDGVNSNSGYTECAQEIYQLIINSATTKADKYDIISNSVINLSGGTNIPKDKKIEVKKYDERNEYTLSEFIGLYKKRVDIETYRNQNNNHFIKYNDIIREVVRLLNDDDNGLANTFKGEDSLYGVFVGDYQFYKYNQIDLFWSTQSDQTRGSRVGELRLTLKFKIRDGQTPSQWVEGNCNLQQNESTDRLDNIIENFFDTGKFVF